MKNEIILFENQGVKLEVNVQDDTVWLSADAMAKLFDRDYKTIRKHIKNALNEELDESTVAKFATTTKHGALPDKVQTNLVNYYNLDMIISVGYRVKSHNGIVFRKWANSVLKDYLLKGYAVNQRRLEYLEKTVKLIDIAGRISETENNDALNIIKVINNYSNALNLLDNYDHKILVKPNGSTSDKKITYDDCLDIITKLKFNNDSNIFGLERDKGLSSIINDIYSTFDGNDV